MQTPEAFIVGHSTVSSAARVAQARGMVKRTFWSLGLLAIVVVVLTLMNPDRWTLAATLRSIVPALLIWVAFLIWRLLSLRSARTALAKVSTGEAFRIDHHGITLAQSGEVIDWGAIREFKAERGSRSAGPLLVLEHAQGRYQVPLAFLDTLPGTIDSALRAYSGARRGLDLSNLDTVTAF